MRKVWLTACVGLALAACAPQEVDPLEEAARTCETGAGAALIAACTTIIDTPGPTQAARAEA
nr:hypothetical protein [Terricaulis sp.]